MAANQEWITPRKGKKVNTGKSKIVEKKVEKTVELTDKERARLISDAQKSAENIAKLQQSYQQNLKWDRSKVATIITNLTSEPATTVMPVTTTQPNKLSSTRRQYRSEKDKVLQHSYSRTSATLTISEEEKLAQAKVRMVRARKEYNIIKTRIFCNEVARMTIEEKRIIFLAAVAKLFNKIYFQLLCVDNGWTISYDRTTDPEQRYHNTILDQFAIAYYDKFVPYSDTEAMALKFPKVGLTSVNSVEYYQAANGSYFTVKELVNDVLIPFLNKNMKELKMNGGILRHESYGFHYDGFTDCPIFCPIFTGIFSQNN